MARIILFGGGLQTLSIGRGLKDFDHIVYNLADNKAVGKYSNFIDKFIPIELDVFTPEELIKLIQRNGIDLIIPMEDEYAEWLSKHKRRISEDLTVKIAVAKEEVFRKVINKNSLLEICRLHNIPHPKTVSLDLQNISSSVKELAFPLLIKPNVSNGSRGICKVNDMGELEMKGPAIVKQFGQCTLQEFIENDHYHNVMLYRYSDGHWGPAVITDITRFYPVKGGSSSFCTTIENKRLVEICKGLLAVLDWNGFADFDVLVSKEGKYKIIELNPRVPASVHAAYISGINYGQLIAQDMLGLPETTMNYFPGKNLRFLGLDIAWFLANDKRFKASPSWFRFFGKDLHYQEGGIKDWKAMAFSIWSGLKKQLSPKFRAAKAGMN